MVPAPAEQMSGPEKSVQVSHLQSEQQQTLVVRGNYTATLIRVAMSNVSTFGQCFPSLECDEVVSL